MSAARRSRRVSALALWSLVSAVSAPIVLPETGRADAGQRLASADASNRTARVSRLAGDEGEAVRRLPPGDLRPVGAETKGAPRLVTHAAPGPDGPFRLTSESVELTLDAFGAFGSASAGGEASFRLGWREASTVFEWMAHVRGVGFLDGDSLLRPQADAGASRDGDAVVADYTVSDWRVELRSELLDCDEPHCAVLEQRWTLSNRAATPRDLVLTLYLDGDLFFAGSWNDDLGALRGGQVYQFDEGSDPAAPSTFLGLTSVSDDVLASAREVAEFPEQRRRIAAGGWLADGLLRRSHGGDADLDDDGVTDVGFDVSVAEQHDFGTLAPGESVTLVSRVRWGLGTVADLAQLRADAGPNQTVECEGPVGTRVELDGSASEPASDLVAWRWIQDGRVIADGERVDVLLPTGRHEIVLEVETADGRRDSDALVVDVADTTPPDAWATSTPTLWPPDHRMVEVTLPIAAFDACSDEVSLHVLGVTSDEPGEVGAGGDGHHAGDALLDESGRLWLRRERQGGGDGRVYRVEVAAVDAAGQASVASFDVHVPHDRHAPAVDSGERHELPVR